MEDLKKYLEKHQFEKQFTQIKKRIKNKKIIIYGAGKLFKAIAEYYDLSQLNIIGICDKSFINFDVDSKFLGYNKIAISNIGLYDFDYILVATKEYISVINELPLNINRKSIIPLVKKFIFWDYKKGIERDANYLTILNHTFVLPLTSSEKILKYLKTENPQMAKRIFSPRNLFTYMADIAAKSTAQYVMKNMLLATAFDNRLNLLSYALRNTNVDGKYLEFGVYKGKSINHIAQIETNKTIYGFDSFEGLPETWTQCHPKGHFKLSELPKVNKNVELIKGWFSETIPKFQAKHGDFKVAFIHSDSDLYSSTKTMFELLKNNIQSGTVVVFDEYFNYPNWENGEFLAFQEFISETGLKYEYLGYVYNSTQVAVRIL